MTFTLLFWSIARIGNRRPKVSRSTRLVLCALSRRNGQRADVGGAVPASACLRIPSGYGFDSGVRVPPAKLAASWQARCLPHDKAAEIGGLPGARASPTARTPGSEEQRQRELERQSGEATIGYPLAGTAAVVRVVCACDWVQAPPVKLPSPPQVMAGGPNV